MKKLREEDSHTEALLRSLPQKPVPPGLQKRILGTARVERAARAWTTPLLRACLAGTAAFLAVILLVGAQVDRSQTARLQALINGHRPAQADAERDWASEAEELGDSLGPKELARQRWLSSFQQTKLPVSVRQDINDLEKEVFNGQVIPEIFN